MNITSEMLENYAVQFKKIETCIRDFQVVLNQKNVDDLAWVMQLRYNDHWVLF